MLSGSFAEVQQRRSGLVLEWVTVTKNRAPRTSDTNVVSVMNSVFKQCRNIRRGKRVEAVVRRKPCITRDRALASAVASEISEGLEPVRILIYATRVTNAHIASSSSLLRSAPGRRRVYEKRVSSSELAAYSPVAAADAGRRWHSRWHQLSNGIPRRRRHRRRSSSSSRNGGATRRVTRSAVRHRARSNRFHHMTHRYHFIDRVPEHKSDCGGTCARLEAASLRCCIARHRIPGRAGEDPLCGATVGSCSHG